MTEHNVKSELGNYPVFTGYDILKAFPALFNASEFGKILIVTGHGIPRIFCEKLCSVLTADIYFYSFEDTEINKTVQTAQQIIQFLLSNGFGRNDCIIAVGGGLVGDVSGFVASVYMRGIKWFNCPTTLLSQTDAAVGGKTAVNFDGVKNLIGSFYPPCGVLADTKTLETLPPRIFSEGMAEVIKTAVLFDSELFFLLTNGRANDNIDYIVDRCISHKIRVVENDEFETGERKLLNFGHTAGHAIESAAAGKYYHGECVGFGMLCITDGKVRKIIKETLKLYHLPVLPDNAADILDAAGKLLQSDKKSSGDKVQAVFMSELFRPEIKLVEKQEIINGMKEYFNL